MKNNSQRKKLLDIDRNWVEYISNLTQQGETILLNIPKFDRKGRGIMILSILSASLLIILTTLGLILLFQSPYATLLLLMLSIWALTATVIMNIENLQRRRLLTNHRLILKQGIFYLKIEEMKLSEVTSVKLTHSIITNGTLHIMGEDNRFILLDNLSIDQAQNIKTMIEERKEIALKE